MKLRTVRYIFKEGLLNVFRNKLMFFACCAVITAALVILGIFMLLIINIENNVEKLSEIPQIQVYGKYDLSDAEVKSLENVLREEPGISEFVPVSRSEAFEKAKEMLGENGGLMEGFEDDFLPVSFIIRMESPDLVDEFVKKAEEMDSVEKVNYPKETINVISGVSKWVKYFSVLLVLIPMLFAFFIMSNTIKLAVAERSVEVGIMRYIGATEQLIRWPFVIEGVIIGLIGSSLAYMITGYGYSLVERTFSAEAQGGVGNLFRMIKIGDVSAALLLIYVVIGVGVGAVGSVRSIRKYLTV